MFGFIEHARLDSITWYAAFDEDALGRQQGDYSGGIGKSVRPNTVDVVGIFKCVFEAVDSLEGGLAHGIPSLNAQRQRRFRQRGFAEGRVLHITADESHNARSTAHDIDMSAVPFFVEPLQCVLRPVPGYIGHSKHHGRIVIRVDIGIMNEGQVSLYGLISAIYTRAEAS